jgi:hypothetical protein
MQLKTFQKQDLARAALKDGLILSWDTGLGKTWALYLWPLLKVGFERVPPDPNRLAGLPERIRPKAPVLIIAPGDLHQQISDEGMTHFGVVTRKLDSQETFMRLTRRPDSLVTNTTPDGRPIVPPGFYITSYTQLTTNGVQKLPDPMDWDDPRALLEWFCLKIGAHQPPADLTQHREDPFFTDVCNFFAWRAHVWRDAYDLFNLDPRDTMADLDRALQREIAVLDTWPDRKQAENQRKKLYAAYEILKNLCCAKRDSRFIDLNRRQQDFVIREFCAAKVAEYSQNIGEIMDHPIGPVPSGYDPAKPETDTRPKWKIKCVYSPSLADLCYSAFDCVVIDEGVKMKGEDTLVGKGVRSMTPAYRLVLTATPIKNRLPDLFRLAWWASGGKAEAHARFPYRDDTSERTKFAETFMVSERNLTKEAEAEALGKRHGGRFRKLTAEVCNVHRLWKLFGPIILRRRKQDAGVDIVPKVRKVIRCEMGSQQKKVYQYHLQAEYRDINGKPAIGAQLQALRIAAADPTSLHLTGQPGEPAEPCECTRVGAEQVHRCLKCNGAGAVPLPHRSGTAYVPKMATVLTLIQEVLERKEQTIVFSAFNDPLDNLSRWLSEANVRHVTLDGRVSQRKRGEKAAIFKKGRADEYSIPVMLAGVECMAEGHSFHLANNVILLAYSWAADKFKQALDRVHRLNSVKSVNVYVVLCTGSIDRKLESLTDEKTDAAELVLDGRLIGERSEEINLAELLKVARKEFNEKDNTLDEALLQSEWPALRDRLAVAMRAWDAELARSECEHPAAAVKPASELLILPSPAVPLLPVPGDPTELFMKPKSSANHSPKSNLERHDPLGEAKQASPENVIPFPALTAPATDWKARFKERAGQLPKGGLSRLRRSDIWARL